MSTHWATGKNPDHEIIFGWDPAVNSYFLHVIDKYTEEDEEGHNILWIGTTPNEILDLDELKVKADPYVELDAEMWTELYADAN